MAGIQQVMFYIMVPIDKVQLRLDFSLIRVTILFVVGRSAPAQDSMSGIVEVTVGLAPSSQRSFWWSDRISAGRRAFFVAICPLDVSLSILLYRKSDGVRRKV